MAYIFGALAVGMAAGTSNYFLAAIGKIGIGVLAMFLHNTNFGAVYKSEFILRFRFDDSGDTGSYLEAINDLCKRSNLLHMEPSADGMSLGLTCDIALRDDMAAKDITNQFGKLEHVSEVVLIASKNDVDY